MNAAATTQGADDQRSQRKRWLERVPNDQLQSHSRFAFRSVSYRWVDQNPNSRQNRMQACLQTLLGKPFVKVRPSFLRNPETRRCLELDAYCEELKLGAEFHGVQHSCFPNPFHSTRAQFVQQQKRDQLKIALCKTHGIQLLIVLHHVQKDELELHIKEQLLAMGFLNREQSIGDVASSQSAAEPDHLARSGDRKSEFDDTWLLFLDLSI